LKKRGFEMTKGRINYWTAEANRGHNWTFTAYWVRDSYLIRCYDQNGTRIPGMFTLVNDEAMDYPPDNERLMNLVLARDEAEEKAGGKPLARPPQNVFDFPSAADWPDTNPATLEAVDVDLSDVETAADVLQDLADDGETITLTRKQLGELALDVILEGPGAIRKLQKQKKSGPDDGQDPGDRDS
jgi:hypothetical protein